MFCVVLHFCVLCCVFVFRVVLYCVFVLFVFILCLVCPMLPVSLYCTFLIAHSVFSNVSLYCMMITPILIDPVEGTSQLYKYERIWM